MTPRILITGSRTWTNLIEIEEAMIKGYNDLRDAGLVPDGERVTIVHGGALGADMLAGMVARELRHLFDEEVHPAQWAVYGKRAGFLRNKEMVDAGADLCLAFIRNDSKGATMCAALADDASIPVRRSLYYTTPRLF